jgi:hypothetical protein
MLHGFFSDCQTLRRCELEIKRGLFSAVPELHTFEKIPALCATILRQTSAGFCIIERPD